MAKKDFRKVSQEQPRYPKPSELVSSSLGKLGLAALGGILLGGAAGMPRAFAEEATSADSAKSARAKPGQVGARKGKPAKDVTAAKAPTREPRFMPNGGRPAHRMVEVANPPRIEPNDEKTPAKSKPKAGATTGTGTGTSTAPVAPLPPPGEPPATRMPEEEKAAAPKGGSTTTKTDTKKDPKHLPPPGVPPLPRNPESPAPKKPK